MIGLQQRAPWGPKFKGTEGGSPPMTSDEGDMRKKRAQRMRAMANRACRIISWRRGRNRGWSRRWHHWGSQSWHQSQKDLAMLKNHGGDLGERKDDTQKMCRLKLLEVTAFKNSHRMTVHCSKSKDCPKVPFGTLVRLAALS
jgi:hypothetical protein